MNITTLKTPSIHIRRLRFMKTLRSFSVIVNTGRDKIQRNPPPAKNLGIDRPDLPLYPKRRNPSGRLESGGWMRTRNMNRRKFLKNAAMGGAGLALPANFGPVLRLLEALERVDLALTQASPSQIT
jgi:hypothetical protein